MRCSSSAASQSQWWASVIGCLVQIGNGIEMEAVGLQCEPGGALVV